MKHTCIDSLDYKLTKKEKNQNLFKVFIAPRHMTKNFVAYFIEDLTILLSKMDWHILSLEETIKTNDIKNDIFLATKINKIPDIFLFYTRRDSKHNKWVKDLKKLKTSIKALILEDFHFYQDTSIAQKIVPWMDVIFARYPEVISYNLLPVKPNSCITFYHASSDVFKRKINFDKKIDKMLLSGATDDEFYLLRNKANDLLSKTDLIVERKHPGYETIKSAKIEASNYSKEINKYKLALADYGNLKHYDIPYPYILAKTFEIPASGTAMITHKNLFPYLTKIGMIEGTHYIATTPSKLLNTIKYWLESKNQKKLYNITKMGQEFVLKYHTNNLREKKIN